jgi:hypothetical protein
MEVDGLMVAIEASRNAEEVDEFRSLVRIGEVALPPTDRDAADLRLVGKVSAVEELEYLAKGERLIGLFER